MVVQHQLDSAPAAVSNDALTFVIALRHAYVVDINTAQPPPPPPPLLLLLLLTAN